MKYLSFIQFISVVTAARPCIAQFPHEAAVFAVNIESGAMFGLSFFSGLKVRRSSTLRVMFFNIGYLLIKINTIAVYTVCLVTVRAD
ncbi:MAG: hypothetical protein D3910_26990 [Candidatus Electrothrix sp. ATG2]|nr:hypothetical protein [Candidatus Electrothrix sp. ATG2]